MRVVRDIALLLVIASVAYFGLLFVERFLGLPEIRSIAGAGLFILGAYFAYGARDASYLPARASAGGVRDDDLRLLWNDTLQRFGVGVQLMIVGAAIFGLHILLVHGLGIVR